jgi:hypothetical protein
MCHVLTIESTALASHALGWSRARSQLLRVKRSGNTPGRSVPEWERYRYQRGPTRHPDRDLDLITVASLPGSGRSCIYIARGQPGGSNCVDARLGSPFSSVSKHTSCSGLGAVPGHHGACADDARRKTRDGDSRCAAEDHASQGRTVGLREDDSVDVHTSLIAANGKRPRARRQPYACACRHKS